MTTSETPSRASWASDHIGRVVDDDAGVAAVEFALILPILMTLLMGILDWGYYFYLNETVINAAREGARVGVIQSTEALAESTAEATATAYLTNLGITIGGGTNEASTVDASQPSDGAPNMTVTVTIANFGSLTGFLAPPLIPTGITYSSTMRWEMVP